jgi:hypothetical protein
VPGSVMARCLKKQTKRNTSVHMGVWQGVVMNSLKFHPGPPCPTLLRPAGGPLLKRPFGRFRGRPLAGRAAFGHLQPPSATHSYAFVRSLRVHVLMNFIILLPIHKTIDFGTSSSLNCSNKKSEAKQEKERKNDKKRI